MGSRSNQNEGKRKLTSSEPRKKKRISPGGARRSQAPGFLGSGLQHTEMTPEVVWRNPESSCCLLLQPNRDLDVSLLLLLLFRREEAAAGSVTNEEEAEGGKEAGGGGWGQGFWLLRFPRSPKHPYIYTYCKNAVCPLYSWYLVLGPSHKLGFALKSFSMKWHKFRSIKYRSLCVSFSVFHYFSCFSSHQSRHSKKRTSPARRNLSSSDFGSLNLYPDKIQIHLILCHLSFGTLFEILGSSKVNFGCTLALRLMKPLKLTTWIIEFKFRTIDWPTIVGNPINL